MKKINFDRLRDRLVRYLLFDKKTLGALGEDFRKIGVTAIGVGIVGVVVSGDVITGAEAGTVLWIGVALWILGVVITRKSNLITEE